MYWAQILPNLWMSLLNKLSLFIYIPNKILNLLWNFVQGRPWICNFLNQKQVICLQSNINFYGTMTNK